MKTNEVCRRGYRQCSHAQPIRFSRN